ncbi:hypothetical protein ACHAQJ_002404 [Trichoderma viride]
MAQNGQYIIDIINKLDLKQVHVMGFYGSSRDSSSGFLAGSIHSPKSCSIYFRKYRDLAAGRHGQLCQVPSDVGKLVQKTSKKGDNYDKHKALFDGFDKVNTLVLEARMGDHGSFQIQGIKDRLDDKGITVKTKTVGSGTSPDTGNALG